MPLTREYTRKNFFKGASYRSTVPFLPSPLSFFLFLFPSYRERALGASSTTRCYEIRFDNRPLWGNLISICILVLFKKDTWLINDTQNVCISYNSLTLVPIDVYVLWFNQDLTKARKENGMKSDVHSYTVSTESCVCSRTSIPTIFYVIFARWHRLQSSIFFNSFQFNQLVFPVARQDCLIITNWS